MARTLFFALHLLSVHIWSVLSMGGCLSTPRQDPQDTNPLQNAGQWISCRNPYPERWACDDDTLDFPTVDCLMQDMQTCGNIGTGPTVFYSYGVGTFRSRTGLRDTLNPRGVMFNDALDDTYVSMLNEHGSTWGVNRPERQPIYVARYAEAMARLSSGEVFIVVGNRATTAGGVGPNGAGEGAFQQALQRPNVWLDYELPTLQRNSQVTKITSVAALENFQQTVDWIAGQTPDDAHPLMPESQASTLPIPPCGQAGQAKRFRFERRDSLLSDPASDSASETASDPASQTTSDPSETTGDSASETASGAVTIPASISGTAAVTGACPLYTGTCPIPFPETAAPAATSGSSETSSDSSSSILETGDVSGTPAPTPAPTDTGDVSSTPDPTPAPSGTGDISETASPTSPATDGGSATITPAPSAQCTLHNEDPDQGITQAYCLCDGSITASPLSVASTGQQSDSCAYTGPIPTSASEAVTTLANTYTSNCQVCTQVEFNGPSCTTQSGCTPTQALVHVQAGTSPVNVGTLTGTSLYTAVSNALTGLCPQPTATNPPTKCNEKGVADIKGISYVEDETPATDGVLEIQIGTSSYTTADQLQALIKLVALTAQKGSEGKSACYNASASVIEKRDEAPGRYRADYLLARDHPHSVREQVLLCSTGHFAAAQYWPADWRTDSSPDPAAFMDVELHFKVAPGGNFLCDFIDELVAGLNVVAPEVAVELDAALPEINAWCNGEFDPAMIFS